MSADRVYALLLRCYPARFRNEFGPEMSLVFRDERQAATAAGKGDVAFWMCIALDIIRSAPVQHIEALREWAGSDFQLEGRAVKGFAIVTVLAGLFEAFNASAEGWYGGIAARDGHSLAAAALGAVAGILLVVAGVALLRGARAVATIVQVAAIGCLAAIVLAAAFAPRLSVFSMIVGVAVPVVLLITAYRGRMTRSVA
ncbi:MAG: hypothetical protein ACJ79K_16100 [Gemmatimonadaceae bacterium]